MKKLTNKSRSEEFGKYLAYILRHNPDDLGLKMDSEGYVSCKDLLTNLKRYNKWDISFIELKSIVWNDSKKRYQFKGSHYEYIRACQGHSIKGLSITFDKFTPNKVLYHGTVDKFLSLIRAEGLKPQSRNYVHLSQDIETAREVGKRRGTPIVLCIDAESMLKDGFEFFISDNNVVLVDSVPTKYICLYDSGSPL